MYREETWTIKKIQRASQSEIFWRFIKDLEENIFKCVLHSCKLYQKTYQTSEKFIHKLIYLRFHHTSKSCFQNLRGAVQLLIIRLTFEVLTYSSINQFKLAVIT